MKELESFKSIAKGLEEIGYTLNISNSGRTILRMGKDAKKGKLSLFGPIEIKDLKGILEFLKE